jgi:hypothetical protein
MSNEQFIKESLKRQLLEKKEYSIFNHTVVIVKDPLPKEVNMTNVIKTIEKRIPRYLMSEVDAVYVGDFPEINMREVESVYMNGAIFISNKQASEDMMASSIMHEIAHSVEETFEQDIYGDMEIIDEFRVKRKMLRQLLEKQNIKCNSILFLNTSYSEELDNFFYKTVGYEMLSKLTTGLFASPYACTSLREYFGNGFEIYFNGERNYLEKISPKLWIKINMLTKQPV